MPTSQPQALCLQQGILQHKHEARSLIKHLGWEIGALIAIPLLAIGIPKAFPGLVALPDAITTMAILKMASISIHSFHTQIRSPDNKFSWISKGMFITAMLLLIFVTNHNCSDETTACTALKTPVTFEIISLLSFWYMAAFLWMNIKLTREHKKEGSAGMVAFLEAFIYAVNFPAMLALGCIIIIYHLVLKSENELFLSGATALLIYASSAASICVDHYGRMFIGERSCLSDTQSVALSRAVNIAPTEPA